MNKGLDFDADAMGAAIDDVEMLGDLLAQTAGEERDAAAYGHTAVG